MEMRKMVSVFLVITAFISSWTFCAGSSSEEEVFMVYENPHSIDVNRYVGEMANKLKLDLQDNPSLKLNETAIKAVPDKVYVALIVVRSPSSSSSDQIIKVIDVKSNTVSISSSESTESISVEFV